MSFKKKHNFEKRRGEYERIVSKYPDRTPIIIESRTSEITIDKHKYLIPQDLTIGQLKYVIRKRIKLNPAEALYIFTSNNNFPMHSSLISTVYDQYKDKDGFLYLCIAKENTFGKKN